VAVVSQVAGITWRDARRIYARAAKERVRNIAWLEVPATITRALSLAGIPKSVADGAAFIDRAGRGRWHDDIGGAAPESRPKNTDEVVEAETETSEQVHGGNGESGEVPDAPETLGEDPGSSGDDGAGSKSKSPPKGGTEVSDEQGQRPVGATGQEDASGTAQAAPLGHPPHAEGAERREAPRGETDARPEPVDQDADKRGRDASAEAGAPGTHGRGTAGATPNSADDEDASSLDQRSAVAEVRSGDRLDETYRHRPRAGSGGNHLSGAYDGHAAPEVFSDVLRALRRIVEDVGVEGEPVPRVHASRLAREIVGRSYRMARTRREQGEPKLLIIAVDVSGSCAGVCNTTWGAAVALARQDSRCVALTHSNGLIDRNTPPVGAALEGLPVKHDQPVGDFIAPLVAASRIGRVLWMGDGDGYDSLVALAKVSNKPMIWCDHYAARTAPAGFRMLKQEHALRADHGLPPSVQLWGGINTAGRMATVLRTALR
jgi:hypothetical protein